MADLYLYNSGLYADNWGYGPAYDGSFSLEFQDTKLNLHGNESSQQWGTFVTVSGVDLTDYSILEINSDNFSSAGSPVAKLFIGIASSSTAAYPSGYDEYVEHNMSSSITNITDYIDISTYGTGYYIYGGIYTDGNNSTTDIYFNYVKLIESTGDGGIINSGNVSTVLNPIDPYIRIDTTGHISLNVVLNDSFSYIMGGDLSKLYGYLIQPLNNSFSDSYSIIENQGSLSSQFEDSALFSYMGSGSNNYGILYNTLDNTTSSGFLANFFTIGGFLNQTLEPTTTYSYTSTSGLPAATGLTTFIYSLEWERFIGRSCNVLNLEDNKNNLTKSCFSMLKSNPVTIYPTNKNHIVCKCDCTANIPIYLNRPNNEDVELVFKTTDGTANIIYDNNTYTPAITDEDFYAASGGMTISSGQLYGNFPVDIINNTGNSNYNYFTIDLLSNPTNNICTTSYSFKVLINNCTDRSLYRWTYTPTPAWELLNDMCASGTGIPPYSNGDYIGEERYGTCSI